MTTHEEAGTVVLVILRFIDIRLKDPWAQIVFFIFSFICKFFCLWKKKENVKWYKLVQREIFQSFCALAHDTHKADSQLK